jgi:serine protease AprX
MERPLLGGLTALVALVVVASGCTGPGASRSAWAFQMVQITDLANGGVDGTGVTVAIIDTGIDIEHPALKGKLVSFWEDLVNHQDAPYDDNGHGTAMASILVGRGALAGGAPGVKLMVIKAIAGDGSGSDSVIATAINDAAAHGADIISLSLGGQSARLILGSASVNAAQSAASLGILVVGSAGNDGENDDGQVASPSVATSAISVGAVDENKDIAPFSSAGRKTNFINKDPDLKPETVAPGVNISVAWTNGETVLVSGTSPAAVFVSAGLALVLQEKPAYVRAGSAGVNAVKVAIKDTSLKVAGQATPHDAHYGYGIFQASAVARALA